MKSRKNEEKTLFLYSNALCTICVHLNGLESVMISCGREERVNLSN